jgi:signal transduction histidine kinase
MKTIKRIARFGAENRHLTLPWIAFLSFVVTGAVLLGWDLIEHTYQPNASEIYVHRMHIARGISTSVLVSVGIAALLIRSRRRHDANVTALQQELIRKERLAAVGELAGGVAHEIRNPLAGIDGALTMLAREMPADADTQEVMREIQKQIHRMERLVQDLLAYARPGMLQSEWVDVHTILKQAVESIARRQIDSKINFVLDFNSEIPAIYADPHDLEQAFGNLILNAVQAIPEEGTVEVRTRRCGGNIQISIRDDGIGMSGEVRDKIFEPFFTTKARGTGLGLSLVRRAVENYDGEIRVDSSPGEGSAFIFTLPVRPCCGDTAPEQRRLSD